MWLKLDVVDEVLENVRELFRCKDERRVWFLKERLDFCLWIVDKGESLLLCFFM